MEKTHHTVRRIYEGYSEIRCFTVVVFSYFLLPGLRFRTAGI